MRRWFKIFFCLASVAVMARGEVSAHEFSANIQSVERASNGIQIHFTVTGDPDFIDIEGSPTLTGIYREEQDVEMVASSPGQMRALIPIPVSTEDHFFRVRLMSASVTNTLILPAEAGTSFGSGALPGFDRTPYQMIYAADEFSDAPADVIDLQGLAFRLNETASSLDAVVERFTITFGIYRGDMEELPGRGFISFDLGATVLDREKFPLTAAAGTPPNVFAVRVQFERSYRYDRRLGHLVMQIERTAASGDRSFDSFDVSQNRGWGYISDFPNSPRGSSSMIATEFYFLATPKS